MGPIRSLLVVVVTGATLAGCSLFATPRPALVAGPSLAPPGAVGYVVCPAAVTPIELSTDTAEAAIDLPVTGAPPPGDDAIATSPDGTWAYVATTEGGPASAAASAPGEPVTKATASRAQRSTGGGQAQQSTSGGTGQSVVIPVNLVTQHAARPIVIPGSGATRAIVVLPGGRTVLAASGSSVVPIGVTHRSIGAPLDFGITHPIFGMALNPAGTRLYVLVAGGVFPVDTASMIAGQVTTGRMTAGALIPTGLAISSVYSPHGIAVTANGSTVYAIGQGGTDFGGRVLPIAAATGSPQPAASFDRFGIAAPAALAVAPDGSKVFVVDAANNWVNPVSVASFTNPQPPVRLPPRSGTAGNSGTQHPSDIVLGPGGTTAFIVDGFNAVVPYSTTTQMFGHAIPVCSGASSMAIAIAP